MAERTVVIASRVGLHARPAMQFTQAVAASGAAVTIARPGQVPVDEKGQLVGKGDFKAQSVKTWENVMLALKSVGLDASDIIKLNAYVVDLPVNMAGYRDARLQFFPQSAPHQPASTLIGVSSLAMEGQMIEVEAIAVTR